MLPLLLRRLNRLHAQRSFSTTRYNNYCTLRFQEWIRTGIQGNIHGI